MNHFPTKLLVLAFTLMLWASSCTSAGLCTRGEPGCACLDGSCDPGATCDDNLCVDDGSGGRPPKDGGVIRGDCDSDERESVCKALCDAYCGAQERNCVKSGCAPGTCEPGGNEYEGCLTITCRTTDPLDCLRTNCRDLEEVPCDDYGSYGECSPSDPMCVAKSNCEEFNDPACVIAPEHGCSDTCGTANPLKTGGDLAKNGVCEDSGPNPDCQRGTDCTDCGPRQGCTAIGELCSDPAQCCAVGATPSICANPAPGPNSALCLQGCVDNDDCPREAPNCAIFSGQADGACIP